MKKANRCTGPKRKVSAITFVVINRNEFGFNFNLLMHTLSSASYLAIIKLLSNIEVVQKLEQLFQHFKFTAFLKHSTRKLGMIWSLGQPYTLTHLDVCCALTHKILNLWHSFDVNNKNAYQKCPTGPTNPMPKELAVATLLQSVLWSKVLSKHLFSSTY